MEEAVTTRGCHRPRAPRRPARPGRDGDRAAQPGRRQLRHVPPTTRRAVVPSRTPSRDLIARGASLDDGRATVGDRHDHASAAAPACVSVTPKPARPSGRRRPADAPAARPATERQPVARAVAGPPSSAARGTPSARAATSRRAAWSRAPCGSATSRTTSILIATVVLAAIGVLMIYSSGRRGHRQRATSRRHRAAAHLGDPGRRGDARGRAHGLPLAAAALGARLPGVGSVCSSWCCGPSLGLMRPIEVGNAARWLQHRRASRPSTRPRSPSSRWSSTSPTGWPAAAPSIGRLPSRACSRSCVIAGMRHRPRRPRAGPGHDRRHHPDRVHDVLRGRRQPLAAGCCSSRRDRRGVASTSTCSAYQIDRWRRFLDPWPIASDRRLPDGPGADGAGARAASSARARAEPPAGRPRPAQRARTTSSSRWWARSSGSSAACVVIGLFLLLAYRGIRVAHRARRTPSAALLAIGITAWLAFQAFINIGVVVQLLPLTGITLPFVSAGGSSLVVSFAAVGILLSVSRETRSPEALPRCGS